MIETEYPASSSRERKRKTAEENGSDIEMVNENFARAVIMHMGTDKLNEKAISVFPKHDLFHEDVVMAYGWVVECTDDSILI